MTALRIKKYKIGRRGVGGLTLHIPTVQASDLGLEAGDKVSMYRGILGGKNVLILANSDEATLTDVDTSSGQARELAQAMGGKA